MHSKVSTPNKLINEKSPYLLQHAYNPVQWHPWGEEAFLTARGQDKPIFLSIGYSTCYWCHVMEREVFENEEIADLMNELFINIKVDREERPDVDRVYMSVLQAITGSGGWPMSLFLTPELKPFYAATYIPPRSKYGRAGFEDVIKEISKIWREKRTDVDNSSENIVTAMKERLAQSPGNEDLSMSVFYNALTQFEGAYDEENGGFGRGNKFPRPSAFDFLMNLYQANKEFPALDMTLFSLKKMFEGGMYDHLGNGFHRYSVDVYWRVPHFEKMLYDQAQLVKTYSSAYLLTNNKYFLAIAEKTADYVFTNLQSPEGAFYSAEDAESATDKDDPHTKEEGANYLWLKSEIDELLGAERSRIFCYCFGVEFHGNTIHDPHEVFGKKNVLYIAHDIFEAASKFSKTEEEISRILEESKQILLDARKLRPSPSLDDKILTNWNCLMISGLISLFRASGNKAYLDKAVSALDFILQNPARDINSLKHCYNDGDSRFDGTLEDYSTFTAALTDAYEATFEIRYLKMAVEAAEVAISRFYDKVNSGFFDADPSASDIIFGTKEIYDGAEPSGNSLQIMNLLRLSAMTDREDLREIAEKCLKLFSYDLKQMPFSSPSMLNAVRFLLQGQVEIFITGDPRDPKVRELSEFVMSIYMPNSVMLSAGKEMQELFPFIGKLVGKSDTPLVYVCKDRACSLPTDDKLKLKELLT